MTVSSWMRNSGDTEEQQPSYKHCMYQALIISSSQGCHEEDRVVPITRSKDGGSWKVHEIFLDKSHSSADPEINPTSGVSKTYVLNRCVLQAR